MKVLHLASGNRWTGAAAPAFAEVEALRQAGVEAHYAYVGGYKLEEKIGHYHFAHPLIRKAQNPVSFFATVAALEELIRRRGIDIVHTHLTWDHWIGRVLARRTGARLARTFHARRVLRRDPLTRWLIRHTDLLFVINESFVPDRMLSGRTVTFTPPPLDHRQFDPEGESARAQYGFEPEEIVVTVIGKVAPGRGFEEALRTFAALRERMDCRMMIIGHGPHRPFLEGLATTLGVSGDVIWAGYHEDDLAEHYRASDLLLFTARGSDEGHRAVLEALACGVPVASYPIEGVDALLPPDAISAEALPESLASAAESLLRGDRATLRAAAHQRSLAFGYAAAAQRLISRYDATRR